ncbi:MAG TPA: PfkB family carbohydrate kinase [Nocardioidaceae bacterium]|nr:PfkB family carbohydrate kinase [Nocardioidaceae bacterium]
MAEVVVCGPASWNLIVNVDALPVAEPHMQFATSSYETVGGTSAGKALHLVALGRSVLLHTVLGTDEPGRCIESSLAAAGVPLSLDVVPGPSERHLNLMDPDGRRVSIYLDVPRVADLQPSEGLTSALLGARAIVVDLADRSRELLDLAASAPAPIWTDVHDYDGSAAFHQPWIDRASYVFMNDDGLPQPLEFMHSTVDRGPARLVVCTLGKRGAVAVDADHRVYETGAVPVPEVVDTNGAGDAFMSGCLAAVLDGADVPAALTAGAAQASTALSTRHLSPLLQTAPDGT